MNLTIRIKAEDLNTTQFKKNFDGHLHLNNCYQDYLLNYASNTLELKFIDQAASRHIDNFGSLIVRLLRLLPHQQTISVKIKTDHHLVISLVPQSQKLLSQLTRDIKGSIKAVVSGETIEATESQINLIENEYEFLVTVVLFFLGRYTDTIEFSLI